MKTGNESSQAFPAMSWYRSADGREVWVPRAETVYTVTEPLEELPLEELTYLSLGTSRSIFQEAFVQDDSWETGRRKKRQLRTAGKQRGFLVRVAGDDQARVVPWFKAACKTLVADGVLSKVEAEEATNAKKLRTISAPSVLKWRQIFDLVSEGLSGKGQPDADIT
ncbi:hypothetical protein AK812_SmicGene13664 [Symbiodinium microadriaticum]|uniref:Uncharacterized protein n=1 Tax=Symbiodinium microadriaticum TaxID=2951 RepID=A0A1Q9E7L9_SYMMI|nr:hypothetical protein AK812_SmicGene13664 [Symbiodinium microadriaticum]